MIDRKWIGAANQSDTIVDHCVCENGHRRVVCVCVCVCVRVFFQLATELGKELTALWVCTLCHPGPPAQYSHTHSTPSLEIDIHPSSTAW